MNQLLELWEEHVATAFPDKARGVEIFGVDLVLLDADIAGCVVTYLKSGTRLDDGRMALMKKCRDDVAAVIPALHGPIKCHFERLLTMANII